MSTTRDRYGDLAALCDDDGGGYVALIAAVLARARQDAEAGDHRSLAWLRTSGIRWAGAVGIRHPECVAEGIDR